MGARQSGTTRSVSMENNSPIIDVSEAVAQRLKNGLKAEADMRKEQQQQQQQQSTSSSTEKQQATAPPAKKPDKIPSVTKSSTPSSYTNPTPYPPTVIFGEPTITAMEVQRQKEIELRKNDEYWRNRLSQLEQTLNKTNSVMEAEYSTAIENVRKKFHNAPPIHQLPPCQDLKAQLIACYRANRGESLKCSNEVAAFTNCVSINRVRKLDSIPSQIPVK